MGLLSIQVNYVRPTSWAETRKQRAAHIVALYEDRLWIFLNITKRLKI
jgi:hypothetical protein